MPLNQAPLPLAQSPRAAADARRWVARLIQQLGRQDLLECAELGTAELVANAILHGAAPISVRLRGTASHPRIEVLDGSPKPPESPAHATDSDDYLATFGRGLSMVAMASVAWGASMEPQGKVVWFEPASSMDGHPPPSPVFDSHVEPAFAPPTGNAVPVSLRGLDVALAMTLSRQYADLRRELRLLAVAHQEAYPLAANLSSMFADYERHVPREVHMAVKSARRAGAATIDLEVSVEPEAAPLLSTMMEMFDLADAFCKAERLLSVQRSAEQRAFHVWYLNEYIRQIGGAAPTAFNPAAPPIGNQQVS
ncbi:ATP-binding protein [Nocardioides piscis]|uniref:ATP-binding protein n=1 Tax=Nocardioides piscis TaxID=2714938 RepID=A0A6G7YEF3_9ACTN|nr:ATP-binding protein [Nocardioides piscis]QIK75185.1 ATP-binding protein [Nocardioides piscis]